MNDSSDSPSVSSPPQQQPQQPQQQQQPRTSARYTRAAVDEFSLSGALPSSASSFSASETSGSSSNNGSGGRDPGLNGSDPTQPSRAGSHRGHGGGSSGNNNTELSGTTFSLRRLKTGAKCIRFLRVLHVAQNESNADASRQSTAAASTSRPMIQVIKVDEISSKGETLRADQQQSQQHSHPQPKFKLVNAQDAVKLYCWHKMPVAAEGRSSFEEEAHNKRQNAHSNAQQTAGAFPTLSSKWLESALSKSFLGRHYFFYAQGLVESKAVERILSMPSPSLNSFDDDALRTGNIQYKSLAVKVAEMGENSIDFVANTFRPGVEGAKKYWASWQTQSDGSPSKQEQFIRKLGEMAFSKAPFELAVDASSRLVAQLRKMIEDSFKDGNSRSH
ncbi:hypothetical protein GQ42DRAFT_159930 [Ramicandelaber brevisporus]|nr:hypothetical protein GQ42DRAFT_159930 [Ramicandelaber brevisporus]